MVEARIDLEWWPPDGDEPIGEARAQELVAALRLIAAPVVEEAALDLQARANPGSEVVRSGAPASYIARIRFGPEMDTLCVGTVYEIGTGDPESCSLHLHRDGRLRWRRD